MKLAYCTNIWNHHQGPVCRELANLLGPDFRMFVFQPLDCPWSQERIAMGWNLTPPQEPWIVGPPRTESELTNNFFQGWIESADVLVYGENRYFDRVALDRRLKAGKLTFKMGERLLKQPIRWYHWCSPWFYRRWMIMHRYLNFTSLHYLTMSHWCVDDLRFFRACRNRVWRWGYLTEVSATAVEKPYREKVRVGWCGRFLCWKNVCDILTATSLLEDSVKKRMEIVLVGDGPERGRIVRLSRTLGLDGVVGFKSFLPQRGAMDFLSSLDIFLFPSGRQEGWGAVLPEAMDKCCAVVANEAAGSTLELVRDGENGFTFRDGDVKTLSNRLEKLILNEGLRKRMGFLAWKTMQEWAPKRGAERLIGLSKALLSKKEPCQYHSGLCDKVG